VLESAIEREEAKWQELDSRTYKNFGPTDQESMLSLLNEKVSEVYRMVVGDSDSNLSMHLTPHTYHLFVYLARHEFSTLNYFFLHTGTIAMLTAIEHRMEELFRQREALPSSYLATAEKAKEKERRMRHRQEKMEKQKEAQDLRIKRSLERSQAPAKKREGIPHFVLSIFIHSST
jgi:hypothetical protein